VGNRLVYADTYEQALAQLSSGVQPVAPQATSAGAAAPAAQNPATGPNSDPRLERIRQHLQRYRDLAAQGKWSEAGKELEAVEAEVRR
jgi:uncharacterized membrane protein (UPF0182 family)